MGYLLEVDGVRKAFPGVVALDEVSMRVRPGTVHALMGENGAGKSTLVKIIAGIYRPDAGRVTLRGRAAMIHQELNLMPSMTVAENIWIGREPLTRIGLVDHRALDRRTVELLAGLKIDIHPDERISDLTIAGSRWSIARAVSTTRDPHHGRAHLDAVGVKDQLFRIVATSNPREAVIYITQDQRSIRIADEVSVLRDGRMVGSDAVERWTATG
jgi:inositol transport system ATP-binding protein